jgi:aminocarboxymuconate-semialdehyde decarboxylase
LIIDAYCHISIPKAIKELKGIVKNLQEVPPEQSPAYQRFFDADSRLKYMDKFGVNIEVLSMGQIEGRDQIPRDKLLRVTQITHDTLSEIVNKHPQRYASVAALPTLEGEFLDELDRAIGTLGMKGCLIYSNIFGKPLDAPEFSGFWERMSRYDLPVLIHPTDWLYYDWIHEFNLDLILGWPFDSSLAMARLAFSGVLNRFPNLKILVHHLGGMIPTFSDRINEISQTHNVEATKKLSKPLLDYFRSFYADTVVGGSIRALECGLDFFGRDHVIFGTDYPYGAEGGERWTRTTIKSIEALSIPEEDKNRILYDNARRLYKL